MPYLPYPHLVLTVRTDERVSPGALPVALAVGHRSADLDGSLDDPLDLGQGLLHQVLDRGKRLRGLPALIPDPLQAFGKYLLSHASDEGLHVDRFLFHPFALMRAIRRGHPMPLTAIDPSS